MKKLIFGGLFLLSIGIGFLACKKESFLSSDATNGQNTITKSATLNPINSGLSDQQIIEEYWIIGQIHNEQLESVFDHFQELFGNHPNGYQITVAEYNNTIMQKSIQIAETYFGNGFFNTANCMATVEDFNFNNQLFSFGENLNSYSSEFQNLVSLFESLLKSPLTNHNNVLSESVNFLNTNIGLLQLESEKSRLTILTSVGANSYMYWTDSKINEWQAIFINNYSNITGDMPAKKKPDGKDVAYADAKGAIGGAVSGVGYLAAAGPWGWVAGGLAGAGIGAATASLEEVADHYFKQWLFN